MNTALIDQFLAAVQEWGNKTDKGIFSVVIMSIDHIGARAHLSQREYKTKGFNYRAYLVDLVQITQISQGLLISGLIKDDRIAPSAPGSEL